MPQRWPDIFFCLMLCIALITLFPGIVTILPDLAMGTQK